MNMSVPNPLLCTRFHGLEELCNDIRRDLDKLDFEPVRNTLSPDETSRNPMVALQLRLNILTRTYRGDYHTDSFDMARLERQIRSGDEAIWFWGHGDDITRARDLLNGGSSRPDLPLGTVTVLSAEAEYGLGYGELCRSGSQTSYPARAAIMNRVLRYHHGYERWLHRRYHTLSLVPRNRPTTALVRGGEAIHRIHSRYVQSRFWGFAPWYVMQGGVLEQLDNRHCNRDPGDVIRGIEESDVWHFVEPEHAEFAEALCRLNFGIAPRTAWSRVGNELPDACAALHLPASSDLFRYNHGMVLVGGEGGMPLKTALDEIQRLALCCAVVRLPLDDDELLPLQCYLTERGFRFISIVPPIRTWIERQDRIISVSGRPFGLWCKPRVDLEVIQPFYRDLPGRLRDERIVLHYLRTHLNFQSQDKSCDKQR